MTFEEFKTFAKEEQERLERKYPIPDFEKAIFARMTKISEEQGELAEAVISYFSLQRKEKSRMDKRDVAHEIADVIIAVTLLAYQFDIDIEKCVEEKIEIIKKRHYST